MEENENTCCCCECKAKYDIDGELVCGRHLAYAVDYHLKIGPNSAKVTKANSLAGNNPTN